MYASKKYINEMLARYVGPKIRPNMITKTRPIQPAIQQPRPVAVAPKPVKPVDPNIELAKLQRSRQVANLKKVNMAQKKAIVKQRQSNANKKFVLDTRKPYDDVKVSRLARGTSQIVKAYDNYRKI